MEFGHSLCLTEVADLMIACRNEGHGQEKWRTRAWFTFGGIRYGLRITDPAHFHYDPGEHAVGHALLCCSLAEPYEWEDGSRHVSKLVAAIITPESLG